MKSFQGFIFECHLITEKRGGNPKYSDEHANINLYNYLVSFPEVRELIKKKDFDSINDLISKELVNAKEDPKHPLNFGNAEDAGFSGKEKTADHENAYYSQIERSVPGFLSLIQSKKGGNIASKGWIGRVSGGEHEASKSSWKGNVKGQGRFDYVFSDPEDPKKHHRVSGKDYKGSQAASAQADQATATLERGVEVVSQQQIKNMLANKPKKKSGESEQEYRERVKEFKLDARKKGKEIVSSNKDTIDKIRDLMASTRGMSPEEQKNVYTQVQAEIDGLEKKVPGIKRAAGQEMLQGKGQFSKGKTAQSMWTTGGEGASFRDPRQQSVGLRARAGKGNGREMAVAGDIQAAPKEKAAQKARQSSFAQFSRQAQLAQRALADAEREQADARVVRNNGKPVLRQHAANFLNNNPHEAEQHAARQDMAAQAVQQAQTSIADIQARAAQAKEKSQPEPTKPQPQQPQRTEPVDTKPKRQQEPAPVPAQKPEEKKKKPQSELQKRMDAAGEKRGLPEYG